MLTTKVLDGSYTELDEVLVQNATQSKGHLGLSMPEHVDLRLYETDFVATVLLFLLSRNENQWK